MLNSQSNAVGVRSARFTPVSDYFRIPFHENTGADLVMKGQVNEVAFSHTVTPLGSPGANVWTDVDGRWTAEGDNSADLSALSGVEDALNLERYRAGGVLFMLDVSIPSAGRVVDDVEHGLISWGRTTGVDGGWELVLKNGTNVNLQLKLRALDNSSVIIQKAPTLDARNALWIWMDQVNPALSLFGVTSVLADATSTPTTQTDSQPLTMPSGWGVLFGATQSVGPAAIELLNATNMVASIHDLWVVGFKKPVSTTKIGLIVKDFVDNEYEDMIHIP